MAIRPHIIGFETAPGQHHDAMSSSVLETPVLQTLGTAVLTPVLTAVLLALAWAGLLGAMIFPEAQIVLLLILPAAITLFGGADRGDDRALFAKRTRPSFADHSQA